MWLECSALSQEFKNLHHHISTLNHIQKVRHIIAHNAIPACHRREIWRIAPKGPQGLRQIHLRHPDVCRQPGNGHQHRRLRGKPSTDLHSRWQIPAEG